MLDSDLVKSLTLLFTFAFAVSLLRDRYSSRLANWEPWIVGLTYSAIAGFSMASPIVVDTGVRYDPRTAFIGLAGLFGGWKSAWVAAIIPIGFRLYVGGIGLVPGLLSIATGAIVGSILFKVYEHLNRRPKFLELGAIGAVFAASALVWAFLLPEEIGAVVVRKYGIAITAIHVFATMVFGVLDNDIKRRTKLTNLALERQRLLARAEQIGQLGFFYLDNQFDTIYISKSLTKILKSNESMPWVFFLTTFVHEDDRARVASEFEKLIRQEGCQEVVFKVVVSGEEKIFSAHYLESVDTRATFLIQDLTEKRSVLDQLSHSGRLAAIGETASRITHEVTNPLTAAKLLNERIGAMVKAGGSPDMVVGLSERLDSRLNSILDLVRSISQFSRSKTEALVPQSLHASLMSTVELFNEVKSRPSIKVSLELGAAEDTVLGSPLHLQQVFLNLLSNADYATSATPVPEIHVSTQNRDGWILVKVTDNGIGIPQNDLARIFEPFFTTKDMGRGTGLGLSIGRALIVSMGGTIDVTSKVGTGTTFAVSLPLVSAYE